MASAASRFVQEIPPPADPYREDRLLLSWLDRRLGTDGHAAASSRLGALAADVTARLRDAHLDAESHPPKLIQYDPWGRRIDQVQTAPGWETLRQAAAIHAVVALPYDSQARRTWGAGARVVQHALLHLYGPESATYTCPVAMSDGAAALLSRSDVDPAVRDAWLPGLLSTDPDLAITSGQWMTESTGGSDIGGTGTAARRDGDGSWRLTGEKWFCSAIDSAIAIALARPDGADPGSRGLAPFLVPRTQEGVLLHRLKDKLGTRAVPTAEVGLRDAIAENVGDPTGGGLQRMMTLVVITRLHNAAAAAAGMRRGLARARAYSSVRQVAGGRLEDSPLHRATLGTLAVDAAGAFVLAGHAFALLGSMEAGGPGDAGDELRVVAPLSKLATGKIAVSAASEYLECFGGAGYVEDTDVARLLRDAQVLPIWEGTTNVLALDVIRALTRSESAKPLLSRLEGALPDAVVAGVRDDLTRVLRDPAGEATLAGARGFALRLAHALTAAILAEHGQELLADLWIRRHLRGQDIAWEAARHFDELV